MSPLVRDTVNTACRTMETRAPEKRLPICCSSFVGHSSAFHPSLARLYPTLSAWSSICQDYDKRRGDEHRHRPEVSVREEAPKLLLHEERGQVVRASQEGRNLEVRPEQDHVERVQFSLEDAESSLARCVSCDDLKEGTGVWVMRWIDDGATRTRLFQIPFRRSLPLTQVLGSQRQKWDASSHVTRQHAWDHCFDSLFERNYVIKTRVSQLHSDQELL